MKLTITFTVNPPLPTEAAKVLRAAAKDIRILGLGSWDPGYTQLVYDENGRVAGRWRVQP